MLKYNNNTCLEELRIKWVKQIKKEKLLSINEWRMSRNSEHVSMQHQNNPKGLNASWEAWETGPWPSLSQEHVSKDATHVHMFRVLPSEYGSQSEYADHVIRPAQQSTALFPHIP